MHGDVTIMQPTADLFEFWLVTFGTSSLLPSGFQGLQLLSSACRPLPSLLVAVYWLL
jgi:hypothetical protein